jgi:hypothetical protein
MKPRLVRIIIRFSGVVPLLIAQCVAPFGGGGTETSNPGMYACAYAVFNEIESPANWSPETYLPSGGIQLDPGRFAPLTVRPNGMQAKTVPSGSNIVLLRYRVDTLRSIDSLYTDTIAFDRAVRDSIRIVMIDEKDTVAVVKRRPIEGKFIPEIVVRRDTQHLAAVDSMLLRFSEDYNAPVTVLRDTIRGVAEVRSGGLFLPHRIVVDSIGGGGTVVVYFARKPVAAQPMACDKSMTPFMRDNPYSPLVRPATVFGYIIDETYAPHENQPWQSVASLTPGSHGSHLFAYFQTPGGVCTALSVLFDAGSDRRLATVGDNRIVSLDREQGLLSSTVERILYRNNIALGCGDSIELIFDKHQDSGLVKDASVRYSCLPGNDGLDHRSNRIVRIHKALSFRGCRIQSIDLQIAFDVSGKARPFYDNAKIHARMYYGKDKTGIFDGYLNAREQTMIGTCIENDMEHPVEYGRQANTLLWSDR